MVPLELQVHDNAKEQKMNEEHKPSHLDEGRMIAYESSYISTFLQALLAGTPPLHDAQMYNYLLL